MGFALKNDEVNVEEFRLNVVDSFVSKYGVFPVIGSADDYLLNEKARQEGFAVFHPNSVNGEFLKGQVPCVDELVAPEISNGKADDYFNKVVEDSQNELDIGSNVLSLDNIDVSVDDEKDVGVPVVYQNKIDLDEFRQNQLKNSQYNYGFTQNYSSGIGSSLGVDSYAVSRMPLRKVEVKYDLPQNPVFNPYQITQKRSCLESRINPFNEYVPDVVKARRMSGCYKFYRC